MVKINNKNIVKIYKNIPDFLLYTNTTDDKLDDICNDLSRMKLKKNKIQHSLKITSNINKCPRCSKFRQYPIFCITKK
jgi:hypothetical protein